MVTQMSSQSNFKLSSFIFLKVGEGKPIDFTKADTMFHRFQSLTAHLSQCQPPQIFQTKATKCVWTWLPERPSLLRQVTRQLPTLPTHLRPLLSSQNAAFPRGFSSGLPCARRKHSPGSKTRLPLTHSIIRHVQRHQGGGMRPP